MSMFSWSCAPFFVSLVTFVIYTVCIGDLTAQKVFVIAVLPVLKYTGVCVSFTVQHPTLPNVHVAHAYQVCAYLSYALLYFELLPVCFFLIIRHVLYFLISLPGTAISPPFSSLVEAQVSVKRLKKFLLLPEVYFTIFRFCPNLEDEP